MCPEEAEYGRAIHCNAADSGPMRGDCVDARGVIRQEMMGAGGIGYSRSKCGGGGSGGLQGKED